MSIIEKMPLILGTIWDRLHYIIILKQTVHIHVFLKRVICVIIHLIVINHKINVFILVVIVCMVFHKSRKHAHAECASGGESMKNKL